MTEEERLAKNNRIREQGKQTREKRKGQVCRVYRVKIDISHLNEAQRVHLKMLFVEAKWLYNDALKKHNHTVGSLRYKSDYVSINLQQHSVTYRFYDETHIGLQGFKERIRIKGANQFWNIPGIEFANAKLLNLPDGYYLAITTYQNKGGETKKYKPEIGIDMGIKTTITTSDGHKIKVLIEESERIKKCQRLIARRKKGSNNQYRARKLLHRAYQRLTSRKRDTANKIVHELLEHERVYMQDENISGWHKGLFGRTVQRSVLGIVKAKLIHNERVTVLSSREPTTKYCPVCGKLKKDITLADREYECSCGYREDRDVHAAKNMILLSKINTCGTQEINAFGEDTRQHEPQNLCRCLVELGSPRFYNSASHKRW